MVKMLLTILVLGLLLTGCARGPSIDSRYSTLNHDSRVQYVIIHYTSSGFARSLHNLTLGDVSSHYLIDETPPTVYQLVPESRRAWHAGDSNWQGRTWLNASTIGIEIVHPGYTDSPAGRIWHPWPEEQIDALIPLLRDILQRHQLSPDRVLGHSDIAPQRKVDPGPLFPWHRLAKAGVAVWPDATKVNQQRKALGQHTPPLQWFEMALQMVGYGLESAPSAAPADQTRATQNVIAAFQMRFRPAIHDGQPDSETAAILAAMVPAATASALWCAPNSSASAKLPETTLPLCTSP
jgi:N-acetylmuramoyl-L-alanine amidase